MKRSAAVLFSIALYGAAAAGSLVDYNGDGIISREEFRNAVTELAYASDANNDGVIDGGEFPWTAKDLALFDTDGDGKITSVGIQEFEDGMMSAFTALDMDQDDSLGPEEVAAAESRLGL